MFERFTENARRALFFARYEASQVGSVTISTECLLLGVARADTPLIARLLGSAASADDIRRDVGERIKAKEKISTSVEIPFDEGTKQALQYAAEEADRLLHGHIGPEHLILGMLRVPESDAASILIHRGLRMPQAREEVAKFVAEGAARSLSPEATERSALIPALNHVLDRLSTLATGNAEALRLLAEIRERVTALERQLGPRSE
jgi:ATP-dependent Clp protease ATP-binding subunit ClpC